MSKIMDAAFGVIASVMAFLLFSIFLPRKNAEWGPSTLPLTLALWILIVGIGVIGYSAPDVIDWYLHKRDRPCPVPLGHRYLVIVLVLIAVFLGIVAFLRSFGGGP